jgi:neutral ceramidase
VDYRHTFVPLGHVVIDPRYTDGRVQNTCPAAIGVSMLAGTTDGEGIGYQGVTCDQITKVIPYFICEMATTACQGAKPIAVTTGNMLPYPWTPQILPMQTIKIGNVFIGATPVELTTMTGRRLKETIANQLPATEKNYVVLSTLSNAYAGYVSTPEEYKAQRYESASTHFGPWTSAALQQEFATLTKALVEGNPVAEGPQPPDYSGVHVVLQTGVVYDSVPSGKEFGYLQQDAKPQYKAGDPVTVIFWGAHPKNNYRDQDTFLEVQHFENGGWVTVRNDNDWDTEYHWERNGVANSLVTIVWRTAPDTIPGQYRIVHHGDWKAFWSRKIKPYSGSSAPFKIV